MLSKILHRDIGMMCILNLIRKYAACCLNCGSFSPLPGCLCVSCEEALVPWAHSVKRGRGSLEVLTLFEWEPGKSDALSKLILWLKGRYQKRAWKYYAQRMARQYAGHIPQGLKIYVVPAPSSRKQQKDHAYLWAESLAEALGATLLPCLRKTGNFSQRGADRGTRALIEMEVLENSTEAVGFMSQSFWIFADDIVTTGSTARSAHIALGLPKNFQIWALAQRGLSCGASRDLL